MNTNMLRMIHHNYVQFGLHISVTKTTIIVNRHNNQQCQLTCGAAWTNSPSVSGNNASALIVMRLPKSLRRTTYRSCSYANNTHGAQKWLRYMVLLRHIITIKRQTNAPKQIKSMHTDWVVGWEINNPRQHKNSQYIWDKVLRFKDGQQYSNLPFCSRKTNRLSLNLKTIFTVLTNLATRTPSFPDPLSSPVHTIIKLKPESPQQSFWYLSCRITEYMLKMHGDWLHPRQSLCHPTNLCYCRSLPAFHTVTTVATQTYMLACCVFEITSRKNSMWYIKIPWVYFKFPKFSRINKFPGISMFSRFLEL